MPRTCALCDGDGKREPLYKLPLSLEELGYFDNDHAHPRCITAMRSLFMKMAARRGISLEQLVISQRR